VVLINPTIIKFYQSFYSCFFLDVPLTIYQIKLFYFTLKSFAIYLAGLTAHRRPIALATQPQPLLFWHASNIYRRVVIIAAQGFYTIPKCGVVVKASFIFFGGLAPDVP